MSERSWRLLPGTVQGTWAVGLIMAMPFLFIIGSSSSNSLYPLVPAGRTITADIAARPVLALTMLAGMVAGIAAFVVGLFAIVKYKENAIMVYVSTVIGGLLLLFLVGEVAFPH